MELTRQISAQRGKERNLMFTRKERKERKRGCWLLSFRDPGHTIHSLRGPLNKSLVPVLVSFSDSLLKVCVWHELFSV